MSILILCTNELKSILPHTQMYLHFVLLAVVHARKLPRAVCTGLQRCGDRQQDNLWCRAAQDVLRAAPCLRDLREELAHPLL